MATVSELFQSCLVQLKSVIASDALAGHSEEVPLQAWNDELGRLRVWAANIGADQRGQSSLDYRLRDASHIKDQVMSLLRRIQELILDLEEILEEDACPGSNGEDDIEDYGNLSEDEEMTEIQQIHQGLLEAITYLYQMSMVIRQPAHHDRLTGTQKMDYEPFIFSAKQHASHKYPHADELVIDRISSTMARQRAILKYRERHHAKLSRGIDPEDGKSTMLSETVVTDVYKEIGSCHDMASEAGTSETSYGGTVLEGTEEGGRTIPSIPKKGADQRPFECPYCFCIITARNDREWARHIFQDLMPYVCVFPGCPTPNRLYESRRSWYQHVQQTHPITGSSYTCSICKQESLPSITFQRHVARHLQELALFYLPKTTEEDEDPERSHEEEIEVDNTRQSLSETSRRDTSIDWESQHPIEAERFGNFFSDDGHNDDISAEEWWNPLAHLQTLSDARTDNGDIPIIQQSHIEDKTRKGGASWKYDKHDPSVSFAEMRAQQRQGASTPAQAETEEDMAARLTKETEEERDLVAQGGG